MDWFFERVAQYTERTSILFNDIGYTYKDLLNAVRNHHARLQASIPKGSIVSLVGDFSFSSIAILLALIQHEDIIVPLFSGVEKELEEKQMRSHSQFRIDVSNPSALVEIAHPTDRHPLQNRLKTIGHAGLVLFSSASTGKAKAMLHDLTVLYRSYRKEDAKAINTLLFLNFDHIGGLDTLFRTLAVFGTLTLVTERSPESVCRLIELHRVTVFPCSPTFLNLLMLSESYKNFDLSSLDIIAYGAEPMPKPLLCKLKKVFPNVRFQQKYGTSETGAIQIVNRSPGGLFFKIEDQNMEYKIVDQELWIKGDHLMLGYLDSGEFEPRQEQWFRTGDLVECDEEGFLRIKGRKTDIINVGGLKVFPTEVESALLKISQVVDCLVYGEKNSITGQCVAADVVLESPMDKKEARSMIRQGLKHDLDPYKIPARIKIVDKIYHGDRFKKSRNSC